MVSKSAHSFFLRSLHWRKAAPLWAFVDAIPDSLPPAFLLKNLFFVTLAFSVDVYGF